MCRKHKGPAETFREYKSLNYSLLPLTKINSFCIISFQNYFNGLFFNETKINLPFKNSERMHSNIEHTVGFLFGSDALADYFSMGL